MRASVKNIERLQRVIEHNTLNIFGAMPYHRTVAAIIRLAELVHEFEGDSDDLWYSESGHVSLPDLITGAYWHFSEWHSGQASMGYAALCALGQVYQPNMELPDDGNDIYTQLGFMAAQVKP